MTDEQIDRGRVRKLAAYYSGGDPRMPSGLTWAEVLDLIDALEQAEAERDAYRAKMDELDRAYLSEHGQRKRIEECIKDVRGLMQQQSDSARAADCVDGFATVTLDDLRRALDD